MIGIRSGKLLGLVNCCAHAKLEGSWLAIEAFIEDADMGSGVAMVSVNSSGVWAIQADWMPFSEGRLFMAWEVSRLFCRRLEGSKIGDCCIIWVGNVLER